MKRRFLILLFFITLISICGCAVSPVRQENQSITTPGEQFIRTELIFGLSKPDSTIITESEWQQFVDENITPRFKNGLTVVNGYGQWMMQSGEVVKEPSKVVIFLHKQTVETDMHIEGIRKEYRELFQQDSVLRITQEVDVSF